MSKWKTAGQLLKQAAVEWMEDDAFTQAAALAYYTVFSLAPLLLIAIGLAGLVMGRESVQQAVIGQMSNLLGEQGGGLVSTLLEAGNKPAASLSATLIGLVVLLFGAGSVFRQLQLALNRMWEVKPRPKGWPGLIKDRFLSFGMVLAIGFLLLSSLIFSAAFAAIGGWLSSRFPILHMTVSIVHLTGSAVAISILFALIFKYVPLARIEWRDVWPGAVLTSFLFMIGQYGIGLYIGKAGIGSEFGAAGSVAVLLIWIYYSALICFFGAEFTQVYAGRAGSGIRPSPDAVSIKET